MHPRSLVAAGAAAALAGTGVAVAASGDSGDPTARTSRVAPQRAFVADKASKEDRLDDLAKRIGVDGSKLEDALRDQSLAEVDWARGAGFLSEDEANEIKEHIKDSGGAGRPFGFGKMGGFGRFGGFGGGGGAEYAAAAQFLGLTVTQLGNELEKRTLAEVASSKGKSLDDLKRALRDAHKEALDDAVADERLTQQQDDALLKRFDEDLDDVVNGRSPAITDLAKRLGVDRGKIADALRAEAIAGIDRALADKMLTQQQADKLKERIQNAPGEAFGGGGLGFGFGPGILCPPGFEKGMRAPHLEKGMHPRAFHGWRKPGGIRIEPDAPDEAVPADPALPGRFS